MPAAARCHFDARRRAPARARVYECASYFASLMLMPCFIVFFAATGMPDISPCHAFMRQYTPALPYLMSLCPPSGARAYIKNDCFATVPCLLILAFSRPAIPFELARFLPR